MCRMCHYTAKQCSHSSKGIKWWEHKSNRGSTIVINTNWGYGRNGSTGPTWPTAATGTTGAIGPGPRGPGKGETKDWVVIIHSNHTWAPTLVSWPTMLEVWVTVCVVWWQFVVRTSLQSSIAVTSTWIAHTVCATCLGECVGTFSQCLTGTSWQTGAWLVQESYGLNQEEELEDVHLERPGSASGWASGVALAGVSASGSASASLLQWWWWGTDCSMMGNRATNSSSWRSNSTWRKRPLCYSDRRCSIYSGSNKFAILTSSQCSV